MNIGSNHNIESKRSNSKPRSSNLELYRIICMLMIVAYHYVVNSGLSSLDGPLRVNNFYPNSIYLWMFGMWGKVGINCFLMITGYYMCTSRISIRKFVKLIMPVILYKVVIYFAFLIKGYETFSVVHCAKAFLPDWGFKDGFVGCFLAFYLSIPFLSILVNNLNKRQHQLLILLSLGCYTVLGSIPTFNISFNYITWFGIVFFVASYIRLYPCPLFENRSLWGWLTLIVVILAMTSELLMQWLFRKYLFFVVDSNKLFAVAVSVCSFIWFKNMKMSHSRFINAIGASTFGVLLIHANSDAMRTWLWKDIVDCIGHYDLPLYQLIAYSIGIVIFVFAVCSLIDHMRIYLLEKPFFKWYDKRLDPKLQRLLHLAE